MGESGSRGGLVLFVLDRVDLPAWDVATFVALACFFACLSLFRFSFRALCEVSAIDAVKSEYESSVWPSWVP
jgi:hypothetical protein